METLLSLTPPVNVPASLLSYDGEQSGGKNLSMVLMGARGFNLQEAINHAGQDVNRTVDAITRRITGNLCWAFGSQC